MERLSGSRFNFLWICFSVISLGLATAQMPDPFPFGDVLGTNSQLLKSFQEEMKTLENAAHRVNALLSKPPLPNAAEDQDTKAAESPLDVTVLASPDKLRNGIPTNTGEAKPKDDNKKLETPQDGVRQPFNPHVNLGSFLNSFGFLKSLPEPWWKGKNVCVKRSEKTENKNNGEKEVDKHVIVMGTGTFEHCKQTSGKYICTTVTSTPQTTKTVSMTYQCCEGFRRQADGCVRVELRDVVEVVDSLDSKDFASLLKSQNVMSTFTEQNFTIFAPVDEAMRSHNVDFHESNQIREGRVARAVEEWPNNDLDSGSNQHQALSGRDMALAHITPTLLDVDDFTNEMVVKSSYKESPLRVNIYPGREDAVITVNCARLQSWDNVAVHARVHTVDRVLEPVTQSVSDILAQPQFSQFRKYLEQEDLMEMLANASAVTVFAPNNEAWNKLGDGLKDKYSRGEACIDKVLRHHILPLTLCAAPTSEGRLTTSDVDGETVRLGRDQDNQLMVDDKGRVIQEDIVATNGVVHVLDKVVVPKSAKPVSELLAASNHTTWLELLVKAGLMDTLNKQENLTLLVPTERVLKEESTEAMLQDMDEAQLRQLLLYHVTQRAPSCDLRDQARLTTQTGATLRVTMFNPLTMFSGIEPRAAIQCAPLGYTDGKACHVVAHEITRLLVPPNKTALQFIAADPQLSFLKRVIEGTEIEKELENKTELLSDGFTLLTPTDEAFNKLDEDMLSRLLTDKKFADQVMQMHLLKEPVCCASITPVPWPFTNSVRTIGGKKVEVNRDRRNRVLFGDSATEKCDYIATDGIIHTLDSVILPEVSTFKLGNVAFGSPSRRVMLFGI